jgi:hypothetical protein
MRVKSMLELVKAQTQDHWSLTEEIDADLAICEPTSAMTAVTLKRSQTTGSPRCVLLMKSDDPISPDMSMIRDPIRPADFVALLNSTAATNEAAQRSAASARNEPITGTNLTPVSATLGAFRVAMTLRGLLTHSGKEVFRLEAEQLEFYCLPASKSILLTCENSDEALATLALPTTTIEVTPVAEDYATQLIEDGAERISIDAMVWRLGIHGPKNLLHPSVPPNVAIKLHQWPDFGRLQHTPDHLRIAARLSRRSVTIDQLATAVALPMEVVRPFINACALCGLLTSQAAEATAAQPASTTSPPPPEPRSGGLLRSLRSAFGSLSKD